MWVAFSAVTWASVKAGTSTSRETKTPCGVVVVGSALAEGMGGGAARDGEVIFVPPFFLLALVAVGMVGAQASPSVLFSSLEGLWGGGEWVG